MNRNERELHNNWEESWERTGCGQGKGFTPAQIVLVILIIVLLAALIGMGVVYLIL
ncbi:MAG: hypothetical protein LUG99_15540 [Lachnospiraceae bacterium]|nr:hypothetical protein [Lachnospiraceae bacterium]